MLVLLICISQTILLQTITVTKTIVSTVVQLIPKTIIQTETLRSTITETKTETVRSTITGMMTQTKCPISQSTSNINPATSINWDIDSIPSQTSNSIHPGPRCGVTCASTSKAALTRTRTASKDAPILPSSNLSQLLSTTIVFVGSLALFLIFIICGMIILWEIQGFNPNYESAFVARYRRIGQKFTYEQ